MTALEKAAAIVGSQSKLAAVLGVSKAALGQWKLKGRNVPAEYCPKIEELTHGNVRCEDLRPDIDWSVISRREKRRATDRPADEEKSA